MAEESTGSLRNADRVMCEVREQLSQVFNEYVVVGLRKLEPYEVRKPDETSERLYWFVSGSPIMGGALTNAALQDIIKTMHRDGTLMYMDPQTRTLQKLPMTKVIDKLTEET